MIREKGIFECLKKRATDLNRKEQDIRKLQIITYVQMMYFVSVSVCEEATSEKTERKRREDFERRRKCCAGNESEG